MKSDHEFQIRNTSSMYELKTQKYKRSREQSRDLFHIVSIVFVEALSEQELFDFRSAYGFGEEKSLNLITVL